MDARLREIDAEIARLTAERREREAELTSPGRREIRAEYEKIRDALARLEELGERPVDTNTRHAVSITGKTFRVDAHEVAEIEN